MKKITASILLTASIVFFSQMTGRAEDLKGGLEGRISISGAWALYPMAIKWAEEFQKIHPKVQIDISAGGAGKGIADCLANVTDIGMVSRDIYPEEMSKGAWVLSVTKDAVVPTMNTKNPIASDILTKGVTREEFRNIFVIGTVNTWGTLAKSANKDSIHVYTRSDACGAAETWAKYLSNKQEDLVGVGVYGDPGVTEAVKKDVLGIGYNNINYAYDTKTKGQIEGIRVIPVDTNSDGHIDDSENFYGNRDALALAIANGRYPSPPTRELYFVSKGKPEKKEVVEFLRWVLSDGQRFVSEAGYVKLTKEKLTEGLERIGTAGE